MSKIVIDASSFKEQGGWVLDTQFVVNMGTPYLLAHGLGKPVENAKTEFEVECQGEYTIYAYTFNWLAPWKKEAAGKFKIQVDNIECETVFGTTSETWGWEKGTKISLEKGSHIISLNDLTGYEGRCGIVVLSDEECELPTGAKEITDFILASKKDSKVPVEEFDLVVAGGGIAGMSAALTAARSGLKTALIQDRAVVGGNNSSEVRVWLGGITNTEPFPGIGNITNEFEQLNARHYGPDNTADLYEDDRKLEILRKQPNLSLLTEHVLVDVEVNNNIIEKAYAWDYRQGKMRELSAKLFCDSTGDATLGDLAGADYEVTTNGHMGMTNFWCVKKTEEKHGFAPCPWAIDLKGVNFPGKIGDGSFGEYFDRALGVWYWESGCELDPIEKAEYARDLNFRAMYGAWDAIKNYDKSVEYENHDLEFSCYIGGKRESRRLMGDLILTKSEVKKGRAYDDSCIPSSWSLDVHYPNRKYYEAFRAGDAFLTSAYFERFNGPYFVPYRVLYSRNINNMFMAGRNVSVSHDALGTVRVMRTGGMMGEVVGYAAKMCVEKGVLPRDVYQNHLDDFMTSLRNIPKKLDIPLVVKVIHNGSKVVD